MKHSAHEEIKQIRRTLIAVTASSIATYYCSPRLKPNSIYPKVRFTFKLNREWVNHFDNREELVKWLRENLHPPIEIKYATVNDEETIAITVVIKHVHTSSKD